MKNEKKETKESIISEALADYKKIVETADKHALEKIKKEMPEKFQELLKEELEKSTGDKSVEKTENKKEKESVNESKEKDVTKEPTNGDKADNDKKESLNEMEEIDMREMSIDDIEEAYNDATSEDEFEVQGDEISLDDIKNDLDAIETDNGIDEDADDPYVVNLKKIQNMIEEMVNDGQNTNEMRKSGGPDSATVDKMHKGDLGTSVIEENVDPALIDAVMGSVAALATAGGVAPFIQRLMQKHPNVAKQMGIGSNKPESNNAPNNDNTVGETEEKGGEDDVAIDEIHGQSYSAGKVRAGSLPNDGADYRDRAGHSRNRPQWSNESVEKFKKQKSTLEKRMTSLINENKNLSKKILENKDKAKKFVEVSGQVEKLEENLKKYRNQLGEMAVLNTNIAHVNNLFVNENLSLTSEDKKEIINKFKDINSISESEKTYNSVLNEMTSEKQTIKESVENKINDSIEPSSKTSENISEKVSEKTAYQDNKHLDKIKYMMEYNLGGGKNKKIINS